MEEGISVRWMKDAFKKLKFKKAVGPDRMNLKPFRRLFITFLGKFQKAME